MKRLLLMLLLPITVVVAQDPSSQKQILQLAEDIRNKGSVFVHAHVDVNRNIKYYALSAERLGQIPTWDGSGKVSLDLNKAISIAREHLAKQHPVHDSFPLWSGRIFPIENKTHTNRWCYALEFRISTKTSFKVERGILGIVGGNGQPVELPDELQGERTKYTMLQVYVMLDESIIEAEFTDRTSANN